MPAPSYIICATPRSGSTLLCDLLAATGVAGRPNSFYRPQSISEWAEGWGLDRGTKTGPEFERAYLDAALHEGSSGTGTFGLRLMWENAAELSARLAGLYPDAHDDAERFAAAFGRPVYLFLSRADTLAQAISRLKAEQSGLWHRAADGSVREGPDVPQQPVYDFARLSGFIAEAQAANDAWTHWFARHGITAHTISYEDLSADPRAVLAGVLGAIGQDRALAAKAAPQTSRLADAISRDWAERFARDSARD